MQRNFRTDKTFRRFAIAGLLEVLGLFGIPNVGRASSLVAMDLTALSQKADRILVGTVEKSEAHFLSPNSKYIVTDVTVRSERNLLGVPEGTTMVVRHLGGVVGELGQRVFGEASYRVGEQVLLFAAQRQGSFYTLGMAQGALHVYRDSSGIARVDTQLAGAELVNANAPALQSAVPGQTPAAAPTFVTGRPLDEVAAQVQALVARRPQP